MPVLAGDTDADRRLEVHTMAQRSPEEQAREVADRYWDLLLQLEPLAGTQVGDDRFDDRLPDLSDEGIARRAGVFESARQEAANLSRWLARYSK